MRDYILFYLNGSRHEVRGDQVFKTMAEYLRYDLGLTGTKIVCSEGDCGACTLLVATLGKRFETLNSCIALVAQMDCCHVVTIEGVQSGPSALNSVQRAMVDCHGSQCGYCTPGFVLAICGLYEAHTEITERRVKNHLTGNLCRCTGYQPIIESALKVGRYESLSRRYLTKKSLSDLKKNSKVSVSIEIDDKFFSAPTRLVELQKLRKKRPNTTLLGAGTDLGVQMNKGKRKLNNIVSLQRLSDLSQVKFTKGRVSVGANVSLSELRKKLKPRASQLAEAFDLFASPQIKNVATLAGNIANASPIGDTPPVLLALNAVVHLGSRSVPLEKFFLGYRKTALKRGEFIRAIEFEIPKSADYFRFYKVSQRKDLDISCVNAAIFLRRGAKRKITEARFALGGVASTPIRLKKTEALLEGADLESPLIEK